MRHLMTRRRILVVALCLTAIAAFSAIAAAGIATSPLGIKPLAGLGSCPLGSVMLIK